MQMREKVGKPRNTVFFQWFGAPEGRKVGSLKRRVRSQLARWEMKNCTPLWREAHLQVKKLKAHHVRTTFGSCDVEKVHAVVARSTFRSQNVQSTTCSRHFWRFRCRFVWQAQGIVHLVKSEQNLRVLGHFQKPWQAGAFAEDLQKCLFRGRRSTRDIFIKAVRRSRRWFPEKGYFGASDLQICWDDFAWQVQHFVWPGITFSWQAQCFRQVEWKNRKTQWYEAVSAALNFPFLNEVSQNCFVFDVVNFEKWGSVAEFFVSDVFKFKN